MENPASWGRAELATDRAIRAHGRAQDAGIVGRSLVRAITDELRNEGLLVEEEKIGETGLKFPADPSAVHLWDPFGGEAEAQATEVAAQPAESKPKEFLVEAGSKSSPRRSS